MAETVTVAWVLCTTTTLLCELVAIGAWLYSGREPLSTIAVLAGLLFFAATVSGVIGLVLLPIVLKLRSASPPWTINVAAMLIDAAPLLTVIFRSLF